MLPAPDNQKLSAVLTRHAQSSLVQPIQFMAGPAIACVPMIALLLILQRQMLSGRSAGSLKG
ncbi:hypothetical protein ABT297_22830 [Dactylosporangium sp. NPDC000555]|uniref:hypothetical protein n=1 Tax=Dactylosporangium sp. NPDC000555 TaxID=3154260 RepID=UPI00332C8D70